ncbi:MAG: excinuclease ABC subunit UvrC [Candidatus Nitrotoga sp.]|nr:excinuclease ABC subunit UvrC [Candidatus Nitrotoga sp.]MDW7534507.1 excinuclease ABC subunit UvrC [Candidatus Nitrotoga sp.]MDW7625338.1 excinuclease ABC subunit UvrC [Candidatus Nitrotoga sp.]
MSPTVQFNPKLFVASLPMLPGVYRMLDQQEKVLYVGKAGQLKKRVASYFNKANISPRIRLMVSQIASIEVTVTRSEAEALLLENNLIKKLKPRYNILFRDDKSYPHIVLTGHTFPRLAYYRGAMIKGHQYFGPYPNSGAAKESIRLLQKVFNIRTCEDSTLTNRSRPCLLHQIHRCTAPCVGLISEQQYSIDVRNAQLLLQGKQDEVESLLRQDMERAAGDRHYEQAAALRDQLKALHTVQQKQFMESGRAMDADIAVIAEFKGVLCVNLGMVRGGRHLGDRSIFPQNAEGQEPDEVLLAFLAQHYLEHSVPALVLINKPLAVGTLEELLTEQAGHKVQIRHSVTGERRQWLSMALKNALLALHQKAGQAAGQLARLERLREIMALPQLSRIECFDVSHTMGEATVASCVVYDNLAIRTPEYRRYNITDVTGGDDYAAMRQALLRRYKKVQVGEGRLPDLILIDGGLGHLGVACQVLEQLGIAEIPLMAVAKGVERKPGLEQLFISKHKKPLQLLPDNPALHLIQEVRDEAHRFAIGGHRARRGKARTASVLEEVVGVGEKRRRNLLARFGGLQGVHEASVEELAQVSGVSLALAEKIYKQLH